MTQQQSRALGRQRLTAASAYSATVHHNGIFPSSKLSQELLQIKTYSIPSMSLKVQLAEQLGYHTVSYCRDRRSHARFRN
jgi:hypothetical protein